jgi:ribosomal protein S18 acetylase RimI-like enzyme/rRNA-processing protein FCF1
MTGRKLLIDTNVFIGLEDQKEIAPEFAKMLQLCNQHAVRVFVHEAALADIKRDRDITRRKISLSKVKKFEQLTNVKQPSSADLEARFGAIPKPNDVVDVALLHALDISVVDFLVTQDQGIHGRAKRGTPSLADRVLTVGDAVAWLRAAFEPTKVVLPFVEELPAHAIAPTDDIFDSLRQGYPDFDKWWRDKCGHDHRQCWAATIDSELAGLVVRKEETHAEARTKYPGPKILKICTFKVKPKFRGEKLGELLLKQVLWFAQKNAFDLVYLTTFDDQKVLISVLKYFGFEKTGINDRGEDIYEKPLPRERLIPATGDDLFYLARMNYPRFVGRPPADAFCVPIRGEYHDVLFPELAIRTQGDLFGVAAIYGSNQAARTPGNTIRKVYLCRAPTTKLKPGSVLLFYRSLSRGYIASQSVTSVGVVESVTNASSLEELVRLTAKRSVYSEDQLEGFQATKARPVKVIDFLLIGHLDPLMKLTELNDTGVFNGHPPQCICQLPSQRFDPVRRRMTFSFEV